jgi:hypothetical protein
MWAGREGLKMKVEDYQVVIPAKAGIHVDFELPNGFPLSRE